jgi:CRISPR/Cas system-associated exonuclease Cas4 (RecB family)
MPRISKEGTVLFSAAEVGTFTVCEEQWRLKHLEHNTPTRENSQAEGERLHHEWSKAITETVFLNKHALFALLLIVLALPIRMILAKRGLSEFDGISTNSLLAGWVFFCCAVYVISMVLRVSANKKKESGVSGGAILQIDGSAMLPAKLYISPHLGLSGKPDGLIQEGSHFIPIERKPLSNKIRDRFVAQLLVYLRLIGDDTKNPPPHGYLILGKKCRKVKIENSKDRQQWLQKHLDKMTAIYRGIPATPTPEVSKCASCGVRTKCVYGKKN